MSVRLVGDRNAWEDYRWWQARDRKVLQRINALIADIVQNPTTGIGKPEALRDNFAGYWSRRITGEHRIIYKVDGNEIRVASCRYHHG